MTPIVMRKIQAISLMKMRARKLDQPTVADAVVVHHGLVWGGGLRRLDGWLLQRVRVVVDAGINLFAYHLPLDAHPTLGNNAGLARVLDVREARPFGRYKGQLIGAAGADADDEAAAREQVEGGELLGGAQRVALGEDEHVAEQLGPLGDGGEALAGRPLTPSPAPPAAPC